MGEIAYELEVDRSTIHRWFGHRDRLLGEALWSLAQATLEHAQRRTKGHGRQRVLTTLDRFLTDLSAFAPFRAFLTREPQAAARVLMTPRGDVERRAVDAFADLLASEQARGLELPVDVHAMAYALVRVGEAFVYADILADAAPDVPRAIEIFGLMLPAPSPPVR